MQNTVKEKNKPKLLLHIGYVKPDAGWGRRSLHSHDFCEIMFVKEGSGKISIGGNHEHKFTKGDIIVYNPGTVHCEWLDDVSPREVNFLGISNLNIEGLALGQLCKGDYAVLHSDGEYSTLCFYIERLFCEKDMHDSQSSNISKNLLNIIISCIIRLSKETEKATEHKKTHAEIKRYMDHHYTEIDTIDNLCRELFINKYYLTHLFKDTYGVPPLKYVTQKRIALAKHLLVNTDRRVDDVSNMCGYNDVAYFCRIFKKSESVTPLQFRKQHRL